MATLPALDILFQTEVSYLDPLPSKKELNSIKVLGHLSEHPLSSSDYWPKRGLQNQSWTD